MAVYSEWGPPVLWECGQAFGGDLRGIDGKENV